MVMDEIWRRDLPVHLFIRESLILAGCLLVSPYLPNAFHPGTIQCCTDDAVLFAL